MRLLFLSACASREGDINHALLVLEHLPADVRIVAIALPTGPVTEALAALPNVERCERMDMGGSEFSGRASGPLAKGLAFLRALRHVLRTARRERIDLICSIDRTASAYLATICARLCALPFVLIAAYPFYGQAGLRNRFVLRQAKLIVSHSQYLTDRLRRFAGAGNRIETIPDPVEVDLYQPDSPACASQRAEWRLPEGGTAVILPGRINRYKGHDDVVRAAQIVVAERPKTRFFFCGRPDLELVDFDGQPGTFQAYLERLIPSVGLSEFVRFLGYVPDIRAAIGAADIVLMPSHEEPYGLVALEGMAMARPVIATKAGGVTEYLHDGEAGLLVPPRDPAALAAAIIRLIDQPIAAAEMGRRGRALIVEQYNPERYIQALLPFLHWAAQSGKRSNGVGQRESTAEPRTVSAGKP